MRKGKSPKAHKAHTMTNRPGNMHQSMTPPPMVGGPQLGGPMPPPGELPPMQPGAPGMGAGY